MNPITNDVNMIYTFLILYSQTRNIGISESIKLDISNDNDTEHIKNEMICAMTIENITI